MRLRVDFDNYASVFVFSNFIYLLVFVCSGFIFCVDLDFVALEIEFGWVELCKFGS